MPEALAPAYYTAAGRGWRRDVWALLHPPYTAWHLSYVVIGAGLAPRVSSFRLGATLVAFFLPVGISAPPPDQLHRRPLPPPIPPSLLKAAAGVGLAGAVGLGFAGLPIVGLGLLPLMALGVLFVFAYNLELLRGRLHGDFWFALSWGAFPLLTAYFAQAGSISIAAIVAAAGAFALSFGQRALSTPARTLRRRTRSVSGVVTLNDGSQVMLDEAALLRPLELALRAFSWGVVAMAAGLIASRLLCRTYHSVCHEPLECDAAQASAQGLVARGRCRGRRRRTREPGRHHSPRPGQARFDGRLRDGAGAPLRGQRDISRLQLAPPRQRLAATTGSRHDLRFHCGHLHAARIQRPRRLVAPRSPDHDLDLRVGGCGGSRAVPAHPARSSGGPLPGGGMDRPGRASAAQCGSWVGRGAAGGAPRA